ncbi:MAG: cell envelope biogenesis protein TolA [Pseudomonadota bacterium]
MDRGTLFSGVGHVGLVLWVVLGDWLFTSEKAPEVAVTEVSMMTAAEFDALQAAAPSTPVPSEQPAEIATPDPVTPEVDPAPAPEAVTEPAPTPEALPEPEPLPEPVVEPQPEDVPDPIAPPAEVEQPLASLNTSVRPKPRPADRVAPTPVETPDPEAVTSEEPTPAVSDAPAEEPQVVEEAVPEAVPEEAGDVLRTEATEEQTEALGMTASIRPKSRPARRPVETPAETETAAAEPTDTTSDADAIAAAVAEAAAEAAAEPAETGGAPNAPAGPPMTFGETDALRVAVQGCWSLGTVSSEAMRTTVIVRVDMDQSGKPVIDSIRMTGSEGGSDASANVMFGAAKRAIIRCTKQGYPLPSEKYEAWKDLELVFDPSGMVTR